MNEENCTAEELCRQHMGRAKEALSIPKQRMNETELVIATLTSVQTDISMAMFQLGQMFESGDKK